MCGFTLVKNRDTREFFDDFGTTGLICRDIFFKNNLIFRACGDHIVAAPPLIISKKEIDNMLAIASVCMREFEELMDKKLDCDTDKAA